MKWQIGISIIVLIVLTLTAVPVVPTVTLAQEAAFVLPEPTGDYQIGTAWRHWVDESRDEVLTETQDDARELIVRFWYPADIEEDTAPALYLPNVEIVAPATERL